MTEPHSRSAHAHIDAEFFKLSQLDGESTAVLGAARGTGMLSLVPPCSVTEHFRYGQCCSQRAHRAEGEGEDAGGRAGDRSGSRGAEEAEGRARGPGEELLDGRRRKQEANVDEVCSK